MRCSRCDLSGTVLHEMDSPSSSVFSQTAFVRHETECVSSAPYNQSICENLRNLWMQMPQSLGFFFGTVWNDGIDSSMTTHGNLSSRKIAFCGANGVGSSSDAIVKSIVSESWLSSKNKCVPQHAANERIRLAYATLRGSPLVTTRSARGIDPHCT
jgi:hypothetical protein